MLSISLFNWKAEVDFVKDWVDNILPIIRSIIGTQILKTPFDTPFDFNIFAGIIINYSNSIVRRRSFYLTLKLAVPVKLKKMQNFNKIFHSLPFENQICSVGVNKEIWFRWVKNTTLKHHWEKNWESLKHVLKGELFMKKRCKHFNADGNRFQDLE